MFRLLVFASCLVAAAPAMSAPTQVQPAPVAPAELTLKSAFQKDFYVGVAINAAQIAGRDRIGDALITSQFDSISLENALKWGSVHPQPDQYNFALADQYVAFGQKNGMWIVGHTLVWHNQTPAWVFNDSSGKPLDRDALLQRMHDHIQAVVGRYRGRIQSWDVVNEALNDDGTLRKSPWLTIIGEDYIAKAFQYAHEADPAAQLTYNDYSLENPAKRKGALALIARLKQAGVPVSAVGLQSHESLQWPSPQHLDETIAAFEKLGLKVNISELDLDVLPRATREQTADVTLRVKADPALNPYVAGLPAPVQQQLADRYAALFRVFVKYRHTISRVTLWGVTDRDSWLNHWPVPDRTNYPMLFDRDGRPKLALAAVIKTAVAGQ